MTITLWHVYGAQTDSPLNDMIKRFNDTVGKEQGIQVEVTMVSNNNNIHKDILAAANGDPGAPTLPDLFVAYPKTVLAMPDESVLVDYRDYFTEQELSAFVPAFLEDGTVNDRLVILPVAKSTELMFVNKTVFDRFAQATGASLEELQTWEGLYAMARRYTDWTDAQTPEIPNDGKAFFVHDFHFNYFQVGVESLGEEFFDHEAIRFGPAFLRAWKPYAEAAIAGGVWLQGGYATEPLRTGESIVSVASSASVLYFSNEVIYADNTSEQVELIALPCPVFADGENMVMQRGAGMCAVKSTPEREQALYRFVEHGGAALFIHNGLVGFGTRSLYHHLTGGVFIEHPPLMRTNYVAIKKDHPIMKGVQPFSGEDEKYFCHIDVADVDIFLGGDDPEHAGTIAGWCKTVGKGRTAAVTPGHTFEIVENPNMTRLIQNAAAWALEKEA